MSNTLQDLSNALAASVEIAGKGTVRVEARRRMPATGIVWNADGVIVTANHVVRHDENIQIGLADGETITATLVGRDPTTDLAVLRAEAKNLPPLTWVDDTAIQVGHLVLALGRPGQTVQATLGVVSALGKSWRTPMGGQIDHYLQTDVVMYPGFSGGPLVSADGQVLGLNTSALLRGVSVAVPGSTVRRVVEDLLKHGRLRRGYLGISTQPVRLPEEFAAKFNQETGLLIASVEKDSPAAKGGLLLGDTIVTFNGAAIGQHDDLLAHLGGDTVGQEVAVILIRGGQQQELKVTVGEK